MKHCPSLWRVEVSETPLVISEISSFYLSDVKMTLSSLRNGRKSGLQRRSHVRKSDQFMTLELKFSENICPHVPQFVFVLQ